MKKFAGSIALAGIIYALPVMMTGNTFVGSTAQAAEKVETERATKKVPSMRNRVYAKLARAQKLSEDGDTAAGLEVLKEVESHIEQLNAYEEAMLWNFYGFMYYGVEDMKNAALSFEKVVSDPDSIPDSLYLSTTYSLAQLSMQQQDFSKAIVFLKKWRVANRRDLTASQHILFAQAYYSDQKYADTLKHVDDAIAVHQALGGVEKEQWLILQRAAYYELKQPENVTKVIEKLVKLYDKPEYWIQLAGMYGETGHEKKQLATMETAFQAGYVTKASDISMLGQLYLFNQLPYKAAALLDVNIEKGVLTANEKNLSLMAQAYMQAKEDEKAIPVLVKVAEISESGKYNAQLAQVYLNSEKWQLAIDSAELAISRGGLDNNGNMYLVLGMANFNLEKFDQSLLAFTKAQEIKSVAKTAQQWHSYVNKEKGYQLQLAMLENQG